ncbi:MAG: aminotransferase class IV [Xanthomonadaceae bacterium]|nr:aminotransferase class IV [Xanthomonadaceae bacterium]
MKQAFDERNRDIQVCVNGVLRHRDEPAVSVFDSVVQGGDAVWEGLRVYDGRIFRLDAHLDRLERSAKAIAFDDIPSRKRIIGDIRKTLAANGMRDGVHIRLTLTRGVKYTSGMDPRLNTGGPTLIVVAEFKPPVYDKAGVKLATVSVRRPPPEVVDQKIHSNNLLNSILAKLEATRAGADDALMLDTRGFVAETNATHLFLVNDGEVGTPDTIACPEGITRATVIELCERHGIPCRVRDIHVEEFKDADEVFCTGTMGELVAVTEIDDRRVGKSAGPVTSRISGLFAELTAAEGTPVVD